MKTGGVVRAFRLITLPLLLTSIPFAAAQNPQPTPKPPQVQKPKPTFWERLLRFAGISATPNAQKAPGDEATAGDIWLVQVNSSGASRLTHEGGYRSPIFLTGDTKVIALKGPDVMEIPVAGGEPKKLLCVKQVVKLVGANMDDPNSILVLIKDENRNPALGLLTLHDGLVSRIPAEASDEYRKALTHAESWERVYGSTKVFVKTEVKNDLVGVIEWSDVYIKQNNSPPRNLSQCNGTNCSQPSLSQSGRSVAYVKEEPR